MFESLPPGEGDDPQGTGSLSSSELIARLSPWEAGRWFTVAELLAAVTVMGPGFRRIGMLEEIASKALDDCQQVAVLRLWEREGAYVAARQQEAIAGAAGESPTTIDERDWAVMEVAAALSLAHSTAVGRVATARSLTGTLTGTLSALRSGAVTFLHARVLAEETRDLTPAAAREVEARVLPKAGGTSIGKFRKHTRTAVVAVDVEAADRRYQRARVDRWVRICPLSDGMAILEAKLTADQALGVYRSLDAMAYADKAALGPAAPRLECLRADALIASVLAERPIPPVSEPTTPGQRARRRAHGRPITTGLTLDLATLLGLADHPGELDGYGAIPPAMARQLAGDSQWRLLITDTITGALTSLSSRGYTPDQALTDFVIARDRTCRFPCCEQPGYRCDIDHRVPYNHTDPATGGQTNEDNCELLCERHHPAKHGGGWLLRKQDDGTLVWTSPAGQRYPIPPEDLRPVDVQWAEQLAEQQARQHANNQRGRPRPDDPPGPPIIDDIDPPF